MEIRQRSMTVAVVLATTLLLGACTATGAPTSARPADPTRAAAESPAVAPTQAPAGWYEACAGAATTPITLTTWDRETGTVGTAVDQLNDEFEAANPGVTIARETKAPDALAASVSAALADADEPDVVQVEQGRGAMGEAVKAGLLLPLTPYAERHGWDDRWARGILARASFAADGTGLGSGTLYGVPLTGDLVGYFFNHKMAAERPSRPKPTTLEEEMEDYAAIKEAGFVPIVLGAADGDAVALYGTLLEAMVEPGWSDDIVYGRDGATFRVAGAVAAAERLVDLSDRGFLSADYASSGHEAAVKRFADGGGQLLVAATEVLPALEAAADTVGYYGWLFYPPMALKPDGYARAIGGIGAPWAIRATSANADCAAAYLDFLTSDDAAELLASLGVLPSHYEGGAATELLGSMGTIFQEVSGKDRLGHRLEDAFPTARETIAAGLADLMAKKITAEEFVASVDAAYQAYVATLE